MLESCSQGLIQRWTSATRDDVNNKFRATVPSQSTLTPLTPLAAPLAALLTLKFCTMPSRPTPAHCDQPQRARPLLVPTGARDRHPIPIDSSSSSSSSDRRRENTSPSSMVHRTRQRSLQYPAYTFSIDAQSNQRSSARPTTTSVPSPPFSCRACSTSWSHSRSFPNARSVDSGLRGRM